MNVNTVIKQIHDLISEKDFDNLVSQFNTDKYTKTFSTKNLFTCLLFSQAKGKDSLRSIEASLEAYNSHLYHLGLPTSGVKRSTLSDANNRVDYQVFKNLFELLYKKYSTGIFSQKFDFDKDVYALDATFIELVATMFPWSIYKARKGAIKMHTVISVNQQIPVLINITDGSVHDLNGKPYLDSDLFSDSIVVFDKGYWRASWLYDLHSKNIHFVTRMKDNVGYEVVRTNESNINSGVLKDQIIVFRTQQLIEDYPDQVRLVKFFDKEHGITYRFITDLFDLEAKQIAEIYRYRWQIELFFKWIKQNLVIKTFLGCSKNAVFNQIGVALIYFLLVSYIQSLVKSKFTRQRLVEILSDLLFDRISILDILGAKFRSVYQIRSQFDCQISLFSG